MMQDVKIVLTIKRNTWKVLSNLKPKHLNTYYYYDYYNEKTM